ncbi:hypothetical protein C8F04DRAFT_1361006 [Mycena alexandri]|uniref:Uncharacterized protein n=1 Tax=Mycena alexandri TaxID=1745969 RepID=A0AAD6WMQ6_9AGAR|nr:hypothetical protein C8F04DRAFT_1275522 [Mycena alexandri]KAJ7021349.1 hypothetical protein C8F04DRAFT_1273870 [Mycena alexandri]KAJ7031757.1 hypothetical protein C8F04DRAFT_1361006 [Mycena alexandri]
MDLWTAWRVPLTLIPLGLLAVKKHPQPVDDCPCFEDAIAFGSVVLGMYVGQWGAVKWGLWGLDAQGAVMPGSVWVLRNATAAVGKEAAGVVAQWVQVGRRGVVGVRAREDVILTIFAWRLLAKALLHRALPPTFRFLATHVPYPLPHRRFYTPATDNTRVPSRRPRFAPRAQEGRNAQTFLDSLPSRARSRFLRLPQKPLGASTPNLPLLASQLARVVVHHLPREYLSASASCFAPASLSPGFDAP